MMMTGSLMHLLAEVETEVSVSLVMGAVVTLRCTIRNRWMSVAKVEMLGGC